MLTVIRLNTSIVSKGTNLKNVVRSLSSASNNSKSTTSTSLDYFDIVISGGGMVGTAMACALGSDKIFKNLKIALVESTKEKKAYESPQFHHNRVCALSTKTVDFFKSIDSFDFIEKHRYGKVHNMHVWDGKSDASITFRNDELKNLAIIVENDLIQASLSHNLPKYSNVKVLYSNQIKDFTEKDHEVELTLNDGSKFSTKVLIGSDGANSFSRQKAKFNVTKWDHDQIAIISTLKLEQKEPNLTAWQRFLSTGPIALLPLNDEYSSLVWSIKKQFAKELLEIDDEKFVHRVNEAFTIENSKNNLGTNVENLVQTGLDLIRNLNPAFQDLIADRQSLMRQIPPKIESALPRNSYPLSFLHASNYVKNRIVLIGDAAHKVHPLAGQGVNLGFGDVIRLSECLRTNVKNGAEIGTSLYLQQYESERQKEVWMKIMGIESLNKLYTDQDYLIQTPLVALRSAGLTLSNRILPLKSFFVQEAIH